MLLVSGASPHPLCITHRSIHLIPNCLQALLTLPPKYLIRQSSPQSVPTDTALVLANLSPGCVNSLLTGLNVSVSPIHLPHHYTSDCSVYIIISFASLQVLHWLPLPVTQMSINCLSFHIRLFIIWAILPHHLLNYFKFPNTLGNVMPTRPLSRMLWSRSGGQVWG